jgi:hypothetical protein
MSIVVFCCCKWTEPFREEPDDDAGSLGISGFELGAVGWGANFFDQATLSHVKSARRISIKSIK